MKKLFLLFAFFLFLFVPVKIYAAGIGGSCTYNCTPGSSEIACIAGTRCERWCEAYAPSGASCFGFDYYWSPYSCFGGCGASSGTCGDGICGGTEDAISCPEDCGPTPTPTPACSSSNCFSRSCSDGSGCSCYGVCSGSFCVEGGTIPGTCPAAPTPTPSSCTITSTYCGSQCLSCGVTSDWYMDTCGNCVQTGTFTGDWCGAPCGGGSGTTPAPTSPPTGTCGAGSHEESCLCGGTCGTSPTIPGCCADGTSCQSVGVGYECVGSGGGGGSCIENGNFTSGAYIDTDNNNEQATFGENSIPNAGSISVNYTSRVQHVDVLGTIIPSLVSGSGTYNDNINEFGFTTSPYAYNGTLSFNNSTSNTLKGANINDYACWFGGSVLYTSQYISGNGPWPITVSTYQALFAYQNFISFGGNVFVDTDSDGVKDAGESNYNGATINISGGGSSTTTNSSGNYTFSNKTPGTYTITLVVPSGYATTTLNPRSLTPTNGQNNINFGIRASIPTCTGGLTPGSTFVYPGDTTILSVTTCTGVENPNDGNPPPPFNWNPDTAGNVPPPSTSGQTDTPTSSTTTWTAPACPSSEAIYAPRVTVSGPGGSTNYTTAITVPTTYSVNANVRSVTSVGSCNSTSGSAYNDGGTGASLNLRNSGGAINLNQTTSGATGSTSFTCLPQSLYTLTLQVPAGYSVVGTDVTPASETTVGSNGLEFNVNANQTATFCIAPIDPWFQTDLGDVRFVNLSNPVPSGQYASSDSTYPGIFYSSDSSANFGSNGFVSASIRQWVINNEYSYNADTENRNGGMSYDFYKSKALKDGVTITPLSAGTFDDQQITGSGVYESNGNLTINSYNHVPGRRVVILVNGNVTINSEIDIPVGTGLFIVAAKGNITIDDTIGTSTLTSSTSNIDGYYTAQGSIIIESVGNGCADGVTSDLRLNVGGALVANSLKPFSSTGTGSVQNNRSLCIDNLTRPSLFISSRPDFLVLLTDFYKTSYTKWREVNP